MKRHWRESLDFLEAKERISLADALLHEGLITLKEQQEIYNEFLKEMGLEPRL